MIGLISGKVGVLTVNTLAAIALAACQDSAMGDMGDRVLGSSSITSSSSGNSGNNGNTGTDVDTGETSVQDRRDIMHNSNAFFKALYNPPHDFEENVEIALQAEDNRDLDNLSDSQFLEFALPFIQDVLPYSNYDELSEEDKVFFAQAVVESRILYLTFGRAYESVHPRIDESTLKVDGNLATVDVTLAFKFKEDAKVDDMDEVVGEKMNVQLLKTSNGWKVNSMWFAENTKEQSMNGG